MSKRPYPLVMVLMGSLYRLFYIYFGGMLSYLPGVDLSVEAPIPSLRIYTGEPLGPYPLAVFFMTKHLALSISLEGALYVLAASMLVGINGAMLLYSFREVRCSCWGESGLGTTGMTCSLFSVFSCCGGGMILLLFGGRRYGLPYENQSFFIWLTLFVLASSAYLMSKKIR